MISLNYRDSRPIYEQIKSGIIRLIMSGVLGPDDKLPSVRELASSLAINPNTIQKAYAQLEVEGIIYSVSGRGSFVSADMNMTERRKAELMDDLEKIVDELMELSIDKKEIIDMISNIYEKKKGGSGNDKSK